MTATTATATTVTKELDTTAFKLLWWDLADLTESKVNSWMQRNFACPTKGCRGKLRPPVKTVDYVCKCGDILQVTAAQLASGNLKCPNPKCTESITAEDPQFSAFLNLDMECSVCGAVKESYIDTDYWKVKNFVEAIHLYHVASAWRNRWFNYNLANLVFYDQRSVRVVPVDHAKDVDIVLEKAKQDLVLNVLPLDTLGIFGKWSHEDADISFLWDESIKFPKFYASDQQAQQAVLDTVKNSILGFVREAHDKVLTQINNRGKIHKRTAAAMVKRLEELKTRDVWNVHMDPDVQKEMDALEGLLAATEEEEE